MTLWRRFLPYLRAARGRLAAVGALSLAGVAAEALVPWPLKLVIDHAIAGRPLPPAMSWLAALPGGGTAEGLVAWLALGGVLVWAASAGLGCAAHVTQARFGAQLRYALAGDVHAKLQSLSLAFHRRSQKGDLMHRVLDDSQCLPMAVGGALLPAATAVVSLAVFFAVMWQLDPLLASLSVLVAAPIVVVMRLLAPRMAQRADEHQQLEGRTWSMAEQSLSALPVVQAFGRESHEGERFRGAARLTMRAYLRTTASQLQFKFGVGASEAAGLAIVTLVGGYSAYQGQLSVGSLVVFLGYMAALYGPLDTLAFVPTTLATAGAHARRVLHVLDTPPDVVEKPGARRLGPPGGPPSLRFDGVSFGYETGRWALQGIDFCIAPGETVALVGATGAGKTTLAALVPRLFDPTRGRVLMDGADLRDIAVADVRERVALLLQDASLLPVSIAENIAFGRPSASRDEVVAAAVAARADGFVRRLPQGYDTLVGERGATLSGGEKQRIAIARALLKDAPILVLDEPTSALDVETESLLMEALARLSRGRTTIIIAHRLSTVRRADRVVVLDAGRIVEEGRHDELLGRGGRYAALCRTQFAEAPQPAEVS